MSASSTVEWQHFNIACDQLHEIKQQQITFVEYEKQQLAIAREQLAVIKEQRVATAKFEAEMLRLANQQAATLHSSMAMQAELIGIVRRKWNLPASQCGGYSGGASHASNEDTLSMTSLETGDGDFDL